MSRVQFSKELVERLNDTEAVTVLTGAGVSAESGVPTFRDPGGIWEKFKPEQLANFEAFMSDPDFVWSWYQHRREIMRDVKPNPGHYALAEMEKYFAVFNLITQNIDNLHHRAGSKKVIELHGNIERNYCIKCRKHYDDIDISRKQVLKCDCGGLIRPDVVWFGEALPYNALKFAEECSRNCGVFFSIGTSAEVYPAASLPLVAKQHYSYVVEINPKRTAHSELMDEVIEGRSGEVLPELLNFIKTKQN